MKLESSPYIHSKVVCFVKNDEMRQFLNMTLE